jgi:hypothetical protein
MSRHTKASLSFSSSNIFLFLQLHGELPEWSNGADSKSVVPLCGTGGSNPSLSANKNNCPEGGIFVFEQMPSLLEHL